MMRKRMKILSIAISIVLVLSLLAGCGMEEYTKTE